MDTTLEVFFSALPENLSANNISYKKGQIGQIVNGYFDEFPVLEEDSKINLAIVGVEEGRGTPDNHPTGKAPNFVREYLYKLFIGDYNCNIVDLGNIKQGATINDTYFAVKTVVEQLVKKDILPIIIGGGHDLTYAQYLGYEKLEQQVEVAVIDQKIDLNGEDPEAKDLNSDTFLNHIILNEPDFLFSLSSLAYQTYFVSQQTIQMYDKLFFTAQRLGVISTKIADAEPVLRGADLVSFDMGAIRQSEAPGNKNAGPNGLYGDQACQLARYAGMSDKCSSIGFYEHNPDSDIQGQTAKLLAQMIWCFMDGYYNRKNDAPLIPKSSYIIYRTTLENEDYELVFVKSKMSDRWWMQVPYRGFKSVNERYYLVPCRYEDYLAALEGEMPDVWWKTHQKLV